MGGQSKRGIAGAVLVGGYPGEVKVIFSAVVLRLLKQGEKRIRRRLATVNLIYDFLVVPKDVVGAVNEIFLVGVNEFKEGKKRSEIRVVSVDSVKRRLEPDAKLRDMKGNDDRFAIGVVRWQLEGAKVAVHGDTSCNVYARRNSRAGGYSRMLSVIRCAGSATCCYTFVNEGTTRDR